MVCFIILGLTVFSLLADGLSAIIFENISPTVAQGNDLTRRNFAPGELIFEDTFETFDLNKWLHEPNNAGHLQEFQLNVDSEKNSYVRDGVLHIRPTLFNESDITEKMHIDSTYPKILREGFYPIRSARITTKESFSFTYGVVEFRARVPSGDWLFPALWLMPRDANYGPWPVSGEIDVMEARGNHNLTDANGNLVGVQLIGSTLHWGPNSTFDKYRISHFTKENDTCYNSDFHVYKLIWSPKSLKFHVNDEFIGAVKPPDGGYWEMGNFTNMDICNPWENGTRSAPFDSSFYLIINLAVGGTAFFSDAYINEGGKPWSNTSPNASLEFWEGRDQWLPTWNLSSDDSHFLIDYVRVWAL